MVTGKSLDMRQRATAARKPSNFGRRLLKLRREAELSARELDRLAGLTPGHTRMIELGQVRSATTETASRIARVLGTSIDWLEAGIGCAPSRERLDGCIAEARAREP